MAEETNFERELTCAICTEILWQPLALLDCLHSFCGSCLKEWFTWQATSASSNRKANHPFTCPSCRESVRGTKADWRLSTMLEGFLKANPDKAKTEQEKEELSKHYKPGDEVMPSVQQGAGEHDSEDERLLAQAREVSLADAESSSARRRRREQDGRPRQRQDEDRSRRQQHSRWASQDGPLTESRLRAHDVAQPHVEHQPSLRSLLSASDAEPHDVQAEIMQSIYNEGLLDGIDLDNLSPEQEDELTERIATAYRRRQRQRERGERRSGESRSRRPGSQGADGQGQNATPSLVATAQPQQPQQPQQSRSRPPISRPHLFEQTLQEPSRERRRSQSSTSQRRERSATQTDGPSPAARSATELSQQRSNDETGRATRQRGASTGRSTTEPEMGTTRDQTRRHRTNSSNSRVESGAVRPPSSSAQPSPGTQRQSRPADANAISIPRSRSPTSSPPRSTVRPAVSHAAFAPEAVVDGAPSIACDRCKRANIQYELHYNCPRCREGAFNLCQSCYRAGKGCEHWFGFGTRAFWRWHQNTPQDARAVRSNQPHVLSARRYLRSQNGTSHLPYPNDDSRANMQEGAFCDTCFAFANERYWYCSVCLEGSWGYCDDCVNRGRHCTHPLLSVAHVNTVPAPNRDPTKFSFLDFPHLRPDTYVPLPVVTGCDICQNPIPPNSTRLHCYQCNDGDYDVCTDCYRSLIAQGQISAAQGLDGWRRCLQGHRMALLGYSDTNEGGHLRITLREIVGGWRFKEDDISRSSQLPPGGLPPDGGRGLRCLAVYNYFPREGVNDELSFPKNAEIREVDVVNDEWFEGVYAGTVNLLPSNHVRRL